MTRRNFARLATAPAALGVLPLLGTVPARAATRPAGPAAETVAGGARTGKVARAMRRAAVFMDEQVSYEGAYVWSYLPDLSATWGEMAARRTMCWVQPPGTPSVGHSLLDAYHATGDESFLHAATRTGHALARAQLPVGGWNYVHDFAGEGALREWYATVGASGWRLEEFQHHYGNATFDDAGTATTAQLLLRLYLERRDPVCGAALHRAIDFVLRAQLSGGPADGGWPQRFPAFAGSVSRTHWPTDRPSWLPADIRHGMEDGDYTGHVTFNDDVLGENIKFLLMCAAALGRHDLHRPVLRAMACLRRLQQPGPQAGWGLQHLTRAANGRPAGAPAGARSYEPRALTTHTTQTNVRQLFHYFRLTGDHAYLQRVPEALAWLESCPLTAEQKAENPLLAGSTHPTFVDLETNRPRFVHRFGSHIRNGAYYSDHDHRNTLSHYSAGRSVDTASLRATYEELMSLGRAEVADLRARSPLTPGRPYALPRYFSVRDLELTDLFRESTLTLPTVTAAEAATLVAGLGTRDHWLTPIGTTTNPYRGPASATPYNGTAYMSKHVGDLADTSPYDPADPPATPLYTPHRSATGITTSAYTGNMARLVAHLAGPRG